MNDLTRIEVDLETGTITEIPLTAEEVKAANAQQAAYQAMLAADPLPPTKAELLAEVTTLMAKVEALS